jgi:hypothetical protein
LQITLREKEKPAPSVAELVKTVFLRLFAEEFAEVGLLYPPLALAQTIVDPVDPLVYAHYVVRNPRFGAAKSVYVTEGIAPDGRGDGYAPPRGAEALAAAMGLPRMAPGVHPPFDAPANGLEDITIPEDGLVGNLAEGAASGVLAQWDPAGGEGHFVVFDVPGARAQSTGFLRALADSPAGGVPAP